MVTNTINLTIQSPAADWHSGEASLVHLATDLGEMEVRPGHASLLAKVTVSVVKVQHDDHEDEYLVRNGFLTVDGDGKNTVRLMGQSVERRADMDVASLKEYREFILDMLKTPEKLSDYQIRFLEDEQGSLEKSMQLVKMDKE